MHDNCGRCTALCCHYVSTEIDAPTTARDFDTLRWYLVHPGVRVFCEDSSGSWFVQFMTRCRHLQADNLCGIYDTRPQICRDLDPRECEFALGAGDRWLFTTVEEFDRWYAERGRQAEQRAALRASRRVRRVRRAASAARSSPPSRPIRRSSSRPGS